MRGSRFSEEQIAMALRQAEAGRPVEVTSESRFKPWSRHLDLFGEAPPQAVFDGGFASKDNVRRAKELGFQDIAFIRKSGLEIREMARSAGSSPGCATSARALRASSLPSSAPSRWTAAPGGLESFKAYVWSCVTSSNLIVLARHRLAEAFG